MKTVLTPAAFAFAAIASRSPPSDLFRYQIHMPEPSKGVPLGLGAVGGGGGLTTWIGPNVFERRPSLSTTRMRPEPAASGTTTTRPPPALAQLRADELLAVRLAREQHD